MGALLRFDTRKGDWEPTSIPLFIRLLLKLKEKLGERDRMAFSIGSPRCYGGAATKLQWQVLSLGHAKRQLYRGLDVRERQLC